VPYFEIKNNELFFPPAYFADIDGLVAVGGDISPERLLLGYSSGVYFWHHPLKRKQWWSPDPRMVVDLKLFQPTISNELFEISVNTSFDLVLRSCQQQWNNENAMGNSWLSEQAVRSFGELHEQGYAISVEVWKDKELVGGLFGVAIGACFFAEYHFEKVSNAALFGFEALAIFLKENNFKIIDVQKETMDITDLVIDEVSRLDFVSTCADTKNKPIKTKSFWHKNIQI